MKKLIKLFAMLSAVLLIAACENNKFDEELPVVKDNVSFASDIQPILTRYCAGCHNGGMMNIEPDLREGYAYESLLEGEEEGIIPGNSEESEMMEMLGWESEDGNNMPPSTRLSPLHIALIKKWIDEGALDN